MTTPFTNLSDCNKTRARPLTLEEVLRLRDGITAAKASDHPYQMQKVPPINNILLALN